MLIVLVVAVVVGGLGTASGSWARGLSGMAAMVLIGALVATIARHPTAEPRGAYESLAADRHRQPLEPGRPGRLARVIDLAESRAGDAHHLLRPVLAEVSEEWLLATHGVGLADPAAARLLPAEVWTWVRPDRRRPDDPHSAGIRPAELDRLLDQLEALP